MMEYEEKEQVIASLERQNGVCGCQHLSTLYAIRDKAVQTQKKLESLSKKVGKHIIGDNSLKGRYKILYNKFEQESEEYYGEILTLFQEPSNLELILHSQASSETKKINLLTVQEIKFTSPIVTINCARCVQQIDVLDN